MTDVHAEERARRTAEIIANEHELAEVARTQYATFLEAVAAEQLENRPIVAATSPGAKLLWAGLAAAIVGTAYRQYRKRYMATGAPEPTNDTFASAIDARLQSVPTDLYADIDAIRGLRLSESEKVRLLRAELTPGHAEYQARLHEVSNRIGRTTAIAAFNAGDHDGWQAVAAESGKQLTKKWLSSHDSRVRETHQEADVDPDNQAVPLDGFFHTGGFSCQYPGDPSLPPEEAVNCRCTVLYSLDGSLVAGFCAPAEQMFGVTVLVEEEFARGDTADSGAPEHNPEDMGLPNGWHGPIAGLDRPTGDKRMLMTPPGGIKSREYPLSLTMNHVGDPTGYPVIGNVQRAWAQNGLLYGEGAFDLNGEAGQTAARQLHEGFINTVSIDPDMVQAAVHAYDSEGKLIDVIQLSAEESAHFAKMHGVPFDIGQLRALRGEQFDDSTSGDTEDVADHILAFTDWRLAGLALVPIPAYTEARISPVYDYAPSKPGKTDAIISASVPNVNINDHEHSVVALRPARPHAFAHVGGYGTDELRVPLVHMGSHRLNDQEHAAGMGAAHAAAMALHDGNHSATVTGYGHTGDPSNPMTSLFLHGEGIDAAHIAAYSHLTSAYNGAYGGGNGRVSAPLYGQNGIPTQPLPFRAQMDLGHGVPLETAAQHLGRRVQMKGASFDTAHESTHYARPRGVNYPSHGEPVVAASETFKKKKKKKVAPLTHDDRNYLFGTIAHHQSGIALAQNYLQQPGALNDQARQIATNVTLKVPDQVREAQGILDADSTPAGAPNTAIAASVGGQIFHAEFFADPELTGPTPLTVTEDGRVFGHVRTHDSCYQYGGGQGDGGFCLKPPPSACNYAKFKVHSAKLDTGEIIPVGALTFGDGHESRGSLFASRDHYNNVATMAAKVVIGDDDFGTWISGEVLDEYADRAYDLLLSPLSGHWEPDSDNNGHLEMIAAHIVVTPGYAVRAVVAGFDEEGRTTSLILTTQPLPREDDMSNPSARAMVAAAMAEYRRAEELAKRIGLDPSKLNKSIVAAAGQSIANPDTAWDGGGAGGRLLDAATTDGKINVAMAMRGFLAHVNDGSKRGDYKLPFADIHGGTVTVIPRGVSAAAGRLNQTQGIDQAAAKAKIDSLYRAIHAKYAEWPPAPPA